MWNRAAKAAVTPAIPLHRQWQLLCPHCRTSTITHNITQTTQTHQVALLRAACTVPHLTTSRPSTPGWALTRWPLPPPPVTTALLHPGTHPSPRPISPHQQLPLKGPKELKCTMATQDTDTHQLPQRKALPPPAVNIRNKRHSTNSTRPNRRHTISKHKKTP